MTRTRAAGVLAAMVVGLLLAPTVCRAKEKTREQWIADLERQFQVVMKKLADETPLPAPRVGVPADWVKELKWRCIGPAAMGGRIVAFSVFEADPSTYWVATASGGLLKTTNNGVTFENQFDHESTVSVGDVCVAPSDRNVVWVGTGESNPRNSVSSGDGVYKSTDGGKSFHKVTAGLPTVPLGRIGLDYYRKDPNEVWAIVDSQKIGMGTPPSQVYLGIQGEDAPGGGAKLNQVSDDTPAAKAGLKSGDVVKTVDKKEIKTYKELAEQITSRKAGDKLPMTVLRDKETLEITAELGSRPAPIESPNKNRPWGFWYGGQRENAQEQQGPDAFEYGGVYKSTDGGESWNRVNSVNPRPMYFSQIRVDPLDDKYLYVLGIALYRSSDGGKTFKGDGNNGVHPDQHALWIDPKDGRHMIVG